MIQLYTLFSDLPWFWITVGLMVIIVVGEELARGGRRS